MRKIAVTGGAGFIGQAVIRELHKNKIHPLSIDRREGHDILSGDLIEALQDVDTVIHLAGVLGTSELFGSIDEAIAVNVTGTLRVLEACYAVGAGYVGITMHDKFPSIYTATKIAAQRLGSAFHNAYGVPVCHVRAFNAYGEGQAHGLGHPRKIIPALSVEGWSNQPLTIWGDGTQTVDLIHTDELARILVEATEHENDIVIDAGTGIAISVNAVAERVLEVTGSTAGISYQPMRPGEVPRRIVSEREGWDRLQRPPAWTPARLDQTIRSYQTHPAVERAA